MLRKLKLTQKETMMINQIKYNLAYGIIRSMLDQGFISYREFELIDKKNKESFNIA